MTITHSGYVAIVGRPNVGKSSLMNAILGEKVSIATPKPQTTRCQILGIKTVDHAQLILMDTPGIHRTEKRAMNRYLNRVAGSVLLDADVIVFMIDATEWNSEDELVLKKIQEVDKPVVLVINKIDLLSNKADILPLIDKFKEKFAFTHIIPLSVLDKENIAAFEEEVAALLPEGPALFPEDQITDKGLKFHMAEIIREKLILCTEEEVPYTTTVEIEQFKESEGDQVAEVSAVIWVEREGQKIIVIGKKGARLKKVGMAARREIEKLLGEKIFLRLWVKIKENWTDDERALKNFGYE